MPDNSQIARSVLEELYGQGKLDVINRSFDQGYRGHDTLVEDFGREDLHQNVQQYRTAFPDLAVQVDDLLAAGDKVLVRWNARGTHRGSFLGTAPTGKRATTRGMTVFTFRNGKIIEEWTQWDALGMLQELGMAPQIQLEQP